MKCQSCGAVWRPAVVNTVGVRFLPGLQERGEVMSTDKDSKPCSWFEFLQSGNVVDIVMSSGQTYVQVTVEKVVGEAVIVTCVVRSAIKAKNVTFRSILDMSKIESICISTDEGT